MNHNLGVLEFNLQPHKQYADCQLSTYSRLHDIYFTSCHVQSANTRVGNTKKNTQCHMRANIEHRTTGSSFLRHMYMWTLCMVWKEHSCLKTSRETTCHTYAAESLASKDPIDITLMPLWGDLQKTWSSPVSAHSY